MAKAAVRDKSGAASANKGGAHNALEKAMLESAGVDDKMVPHARMERRPAQAVHHDNPDDEVTEILMQELGGAPNAVEEKEPDAVADEDRPAEGDKPAEEASEAEEAGEEADAADSPDGEAGDDDEYLSIRDLADSLGLEASEVYGAVVDMGQDADGNRKVMSIGEIKDALRDTEEIRQRQQNFDEESRQFELDKDNSMRHLMTLANELQRLSGGRINSDVMAALREADAQHEKRQEATLLNFVPEWRNSKTRVTEQAEVFDWWQSRYGFTLAECKQIGARDARAMRAMRDFALGSLKAEAALKRAGKPKAEPSKATRTKRSVLMRGGKRSQRVDDRDEQENAVVKLLGGLR